jgi:Acetyltransferase (GNAT) domain
VVQLLPDLYRSSSAPASGGGNPSPQRGAKGSGYNQGQGTTKSRASGEPLLTGLHRLDPCRDARWNRFLERHPDASVFHTPEWLGVLRSTYGYEPVVYTTSPPGVELNDGQPFCYINSWLTGRRLVSLPFSDHAGLLAKDPAELREILPSLRSQLQDMRCQYAEIRPVRCLVQQTTFVRSCFYYWHRLSLDADLEVLFRRFHHSCVQRRIRRARREDLEYSVGRSEVLLQQFYRLLLMSHRRHRVPPQPISWFRNLLRGLGEMVNVRVASKGGRPIAAVMTLSYKKSLIYKYGGSDARHHNLGGMPFLFWQMIQEAKDDGYAELDLGRSDIDNFGLIKFKEHWGARREVLVYWRCPAATLSTARRWESKAVKKVLSVIPAAILPTAGRLLYRHVG